MIQEIIWLASWPVFLWVSYQVVIFAIKRYEQLNNEADAS
jgi:hypothetical protein